MWYLQALGIVAPVGLFALLTYLRDLVIVTGARVLGLTMQTTVTLVSAAREKSNYAYRATWHRAGRTVHLVPNGLPPRKLVG